MDKMRGHKNARQCLLNRYIYFRATFVYNGSPKININRNTLNQP